MNIANQFFRCFCASIKDEIEPLQKKSGLLDHCHGEQHDHAHALNCVLQEFTLRFFALRRFYESQAPDASLVTFRAECCQDSGSIDLVLEEGSEQYAFEFKRWQAEKPGLLDHDRQKLIGFLRDGANRHAYSVVFTVNDNKDIREFEDIAVKFMRIGGKYDLCDSAVTKFDTFTVTTWLAAPKRDAQGA